MKWYGRIGYDNEGIVREQDFQTEAEAKAYKMGADDMKAECDAGAGDEFSPVEDYWTAASNVESIHE